MNIVKINEYRERLESEAEQPRTITFRSPVFNDNYGKSKVVNISVTVENGDALGILDVVIEDGGIGRIHEDGTYYFIPWPCACVEITDAK